MEKDSIIVLQQMILDIVDSQNHIDISNFQYYKE